jgi:RNA polymerase sigma factor FliA
VSKHKATGHCRVSSNRARVEELAGEHLHLVSEVARCFRNRLPASVDYNDLIGDGSVGLVEAAQRFSPRRGRSFSTFARYRIRGAIADGLRKRDTVSRDLRRQQKTAERAIATLMTALDRFPTEEETARRLGISVDEWRKRRHDLCAAGCLSPGDAGTDTAAVLPENLPDHSADTERSAALAELRSRLSAALWLLPPRHRAVVCLYYLRDWTMSQIAMRLGVTEGRVSQIHRQALMELRASLSLAEFLRSAA